MTRPQPDGAARTLNARALRIQQAEKQFEQTHSDLAAHDGPLGRANGDREAFSEDGSLNAGLSTSFTKGLPHDALGNAAWPDFNTFVAAINADPSSPNAADFDVPLGPENATGANGGSQNPKAVPDFYGQFGGAKTKVRGWESPRAGHIYDLQGADVAALAMAPAPALGSPELIAEMAEVYGLALLRDTGFSQIAGTSNTKISGLSCSPDDIIKAIESLEYFQVKEDKLKNPAAVRRRRGRLGSYAALTGENIFRGSGPDAQAGPYISQFLLIGNDDNAVAATAGKIGYGSQTIDQRVAYYKPGADFMVTWSNWLDVQNGADFKAAIELAEANKASRFLCFPRDLAAYVHDDQLYQAYLNAALIMLSAGHEFDPGLPEQEKFGTRTAFASFGGPHLLAVLTEVSSRALKAVRRQKFNIHTRCRPERIAAMLSRFAAGKTDGWSEKEKNAYEHMFKALEKTKLLDWVKEANDKARSRWKLEEKIWLSDEASGELPDKHNFLLPMAFPEGSPMHPSYGAGHATVAGACVTILKAFFRMFQDSGWDPLPLNEATGDDAVYQAKNLGTELDDIGQAAELSLLGELDKLAANISIGRNMGGVHFYSDYYDSVRLGERVAVQMLLDQMPTYGEDVTMRFLSFDGDRISLSGANGAASMTVTDAHNNHIRPQDWRLRHLS